jgi:hypothetical protein
VFVRPLSMDEGRTLQEQRAIAEVLGALDNKIKLNCRAVLLCDKLWQAELESTLTAADLDAESTSSGWS